MPPASIILFWRTPSLKSPPQAGSAITRSIRPISARCWWTDAATSVLALIAEARWRSEHLSVMIGRLDAQARIAALILGIHDRLRRRGLGQLPPAADPGADRRPSRPDRGACQPNPAAAARGPAGVARSPGCHDPGSGGTARAGARLAADRRNP